MQVEQEFLQALEKTTSYTFLAGRLALTRSGKEGSGTMLFSK